MNLFQKWRHRRQQRKFLSHIYNTSEYVETTMETIENGYSFDINYGNIWYHVNVDENGQTNYNPINIDAKDVKVKK